MMTKVTLGLDKCTMRSSLNGSMRDAPGSLNEKFQLMMINGYQDITRNKKNVFFFLKDVANQPVSVAIEASGHDFQFHSSVSIIITEAKPGFQQKLMLTQSIRNWIFKEVHLVQI